VAVVAGNPAVIGLEERCGGGMIPEQFPAKPVHDQQARTLGGGQVEDVLLGRGFGLEGSED